MTKHTGMTGPQLAGLLNRSVESPGRRALSAVLVDEGIEEFLRMVADVLATADLSAGGHTGRIQATVISALAELEW